MGYITTEILKCEKHFYGYSEKYPCRMCVHERIRDRIDNAPHREYQKICEILDNLDKTDKNYYNVYTKKNKLKKKLIVQGYDL